MIRVNPARAGMIPPPGCQLARVQGKPRASGDDPVASRAGGRCQA